MKLLGVIIAFHPKREQLTLNIEKVISYVDQLIIYKNSKLNSEIELKEKFGGKLLFLGTEQNVGIPKALNETILWSKNKDFTHLLTLDQDSYFEKGHLPRFCDLIKKGVSGLNVGIFVPNYTNRGSLGLKSEQLYEEVEMAITSGSIFELSLFEKVGGFNEALFIDAVDNDFCFHIKSNYNLSTVMFPSILLVHELGYMTKTRFGFFTMDYSAFRTFYLVRNNIYLWRKYPEFYNGKLKILLLKDYIVFRIIKVLIAETDKFRKLKSIFSGVYHGITMKI